MQEHLIPQDISGYKFHLIGELDLVQFCEILLGIIGGVIIFRFNWPAFVKWPLIIVVVSVGLLAAFFPIADRPLSHWLKVYFHNLFAPTKFYWRKKLVVPAFFDFVLSDAHKAFLENTTTFNEMPVKHHRALSYFDTLTHNQRQKVDELEVFNENRLSRVTSDLTTETKKAEAQTEKAPIAPPTKMVIRPNVKSEQVERTRQIITPSQKTLDQFLNNTSIFKPKAAANTITGVGDSLKPNLSWPTRDSIAQGIPATTTEIATPTQTPPAAPQIPLTTVPAAPATPPPVTSGPPPTPGNIPTVPRDIAPSFPSEMAAAKPALFANPVAPAASNIALPNLNPSSTAPATPATTAPASTPGGIILPKLG